jgi:hypothetical protein
MPPSSRSERRRGDDGRAEIVARTRSACAPCGAVGRGGATILVVQAWMRLAVVYFAGASLVPAAPASGDELGRVLARVGEYVTGYVRDAAALVCEERYRQEVSRQALRVDARTVGAPPLAPDVAREKVVLVSDYLLVQLPGGEGWEPFRDVYSVNGLAVRERDERLARLFFSPQVRNPREQAERIRFESSRHNIGAATRDINVPTFVLALLRPATQGRFRFSTVGRDRVERVEAVVLAYEETARPTLVRGEHDRDSPVRGRLWVDPATGAVLRTLLETGPRALHTRIEVRFTHDPALGLWVPAEMKELHELPGEEVRATATYGRFRRFQVDTTEEIALPR